MARLRTIRSGLLGAALAGALACGDDPPPAPTAAEVLQAAPKASADTKAATGPAYVYQFNPLGRRDPFRNPVLDGLSSAQAGSTQCTDPLCQWDLEQLHLVAVVTGSADPIAMIEDPSGRGHVVRKGSAIGKQEGKVTQILRDSITVTEYFVSADGQKSPNPVSLSVNSESKVSSVDLDLSTGRPYSQ